MNFSGKYKVTEVRERAGDGKGRYVVLAPQDHLSGRTQDGCLEIQVGDEVLAREFTVGSVHSVTVSPQTPAVRAALPGESPAAPVAGVDYSKGADYSGLKVEDAVTTSENRQARLDAEAEAARRARRV